MYDWKSDVDLAKGYLKLYFYSTVLISKGLIPENSLLFPFFCCVCRFEQIQSKNLGSTPIKGLLAGKITRIKGLTPYRTF